MEDAVEEDVMGRIGCLLGWHAWQRHHASRAQGNGTYYLCRRCHHERTTPRTEGVWQKYT